MDKVEDADSDCDVVEFSQIDYYTPSRLASCEAHQSQIYNQHQPIYKPSQSTLCWVD